MVELQADLRDSRITRGVFDTRTPFREIMLRLYQDHLVGPLPRFPCDIEARIDEYLAMQAEPETGIDGPLPALEEGLASLPAKLSASGTIPHSTACSHSATPAVASVR